MNSIDYHWVIEGMLKYLDHKIKQTENDIERIDHLIYSEKTLCQKVEASTKREVYQEIYYLLEKEKMR